jgi:spore maturation protein CgeB
MKILIVGAEEVYSIENYFVKYFHQMGEEVHLFPAQNIFYNLYKSTYSKILFRIGLSNIYVKINDRLKLDVEKIRPDVVFVFKGMEIFPQTLSWIKSLGIKLANYNPDNPFIFSGRGSGNKNITESIGLYDLHFTYSLEVKARIEQEFNSRTVWLPFGFEISPGLYDRCAAEVELNKLCFVGNPDKHRVKFLEDLADQGIAVDLYGFHWHKFIGHPLVNLHPPVYADQLWKTLRRYRVQLNLMRIHNLNSHNMRTFEVPAVGGIMLAPSTKEHSLFFTDQKEAFFFTQIDDCVKLIKRILSLSPSEANEIRKAARNRSLESKYDYQNRVAQTLEELRKICNFGS